MLLLLFTIVSMENVAIAEFVFEEEIADGDILINPDIGKELQENRIGVSGEIASQIIYYSYSTSRDWYLSQSGDSIEEDEHRLNKQVKINLFYDIRLQDGVRGFASIEAGESSSESDNEDIFGVNELFLDTNINNKVYIRTGKQMLVWGRNYIWNPVDMISVDKKSFTDMDKVWEGTKGIRIHIPNGAEKNLYFFVDMDSLDLIKDISVAAKYEFLYDKTEIGLSFWGKESYQAVYGLDFSSRLGTIDIRGELALSNGDNYYTLDYDSLDLKKEDGWTPRLSLGFSQLFDHNNIRNRINLTGELYYNYNGYDKNIFKRIEEYGDYNIKEDFITKVYKHFETAKYYLALSGSIDRFIISDAKINLNGIVNLIDKSAIVASGISYSPLSGLIISLDLNGNLGGKFTEATLWGERFSVNLGTKILF